MASVWYLTSVNFSSTVELLSENAPSSGVDAVSGWRVDSKAAPNFCTRQIDSKRGAAAFSTTELTGWGGYGHRIPEKQYGDYATGTWSLTYKVKSGATYYAQTGQVKFKLHRSNSPTGGVRTELTAGWQASATISFTAANQEKTGTITSASINGFTMSGEYLWIEVEWSCEASGGNAAADVLWVQNDPTSAYLTTPDYTPVRSLFTQVGVELVDREDPPARFTQVGVELLDREDPAVYFTQVGVEWITPNTVPEQAGEVVFEGSSAFIPVGALSVASELAFIGSGELSAGAASTTTGAVTFAGDGEVVLAPTAALVAAATFSGEADAIFLGGFQALGTVAFIGSAEALFSPLRRSAGAVQFNGDSAMIVSPALIATAILEFSGTSDFLLAGLRHTFGNWLLSGEGALEIAGVVPERIPDAISFNWSRRRFQTVQREPDA